jgi:branched-chain amino acid aminotransferase
LIVIDGRLFEGPAVPFDLSDRGFLLGDGLFETMPTFGGIVFRRQDHVLRMLSGAAALNIPVAQSRIDEAIDTLLPHAPWPAATLRITLTRGSGPRGLRPPAQANPRLIATCAAWSPSPTPVRLALATARRNDRSPLARLKTMNYLDAVLAIDEAARRGFDDAVLLDTRDHVACATAANVFALKGRALLTPPAAAVLPGIMRALVLRLSASLGFEAREAELALDDLKTADELFLTNSVRLVAVVSALEERSFASFSAATAFRDAIIRMIADECRYHVRAAD